jgi:hypothetical protein
MFCSCCEGLAKVSISRNGTSVLSGYLWARGDCFRLSMSLLTANAETGDGARRNL